MNWLISLNIWLETRSICYDSLGLLSISLPAQLLWPNAREVIGSHLWTTWARVRSVLCRRMNSFSNQSLRRIRLFLRSLWQIFDSLSRLGLLTHSCCCWKYIHTGPVLAQPLLWIIQFPLCSGDHSGTGKCPIRQEGALQTDTEEATQRDMSYTEGLVLLWGLEGINTWAQLRRRDAQKS